MKLEAEERLEKESSNGRSFSFTSRVLVSVSRVSRNASGRASPDLMERFIQLETQHYDLYLDGGQIVIQLQLATVFDSGTSWLQDLLRVSGTSFLVGDGLSPSVLKGHSLPEWSDHNS
ncbi:hypothetical protein AVEN_164126-1 [Araneus ventricosus]|uniref:Uncharacterized protein n=1 Tax=Araneus ventricosus TaxID=182803 RepID=A0A4Y2QP16_ARAVE|nr:hypothetical protein AVEN_164126-1 [Araneus ventricosus]